jgi:hypothetical protein
LQRKDAGNIAGEHAFTYVSRCKGDKMIINKLAVLYRSTWRKGFVGLVLAGSAVMASAQYGWGGAPQQDSRPGAFYQDRDGTTNYAARCGFNDGLADGRRDRETGHSFRPTHDGAYKHAPEYGHPPIGRDEYKNIYREAYVHGYEKGYGN